MARYWARMFAERKAGTTAAQIWDADKYSYKGDITSTATGTINKHFILPDVEDGPGLNMQSVDIPWQISSFGSYGGIRLAGAELQQVGGTFSTALFAENAEWLLHHALVSYKLRNGQTFYNNDTFSFAVARSFMDADNNPQHELYRGCKFSDVSLSCSDQAPLLRASFGIVGSSKEYLAGGTTDPYTGDALAYASEPTACDQYPSDVYTFQDAEILMAASGTTANVLVTEVRNLSITFRNVLDPIFGQSRNVQSLQRVACELSWSGEFTMTIPGPNANATLVPDPALHMAPSQWFRYKLESLRHGTAGAQFPITFKFKSNSNNKELKINIGRSLITQVSDVMPINRTFTVRVGGIAMLGPDCNNFTIEFPTVTQTAP